MILYHPDHQSRKGNEKMEKKKYKPNPSANSPMINMARYTPIIERDNLFNTS